MRNYRIGAGQKELAKLIQSDAFTARLGQAAVTTQRSGYETGFIVYREPGCVVDYLTPVVTGTTDLLDTQLDYQSIRASIPRPLESLYVLLDVHFHPECDTLPIPSDRDLNVLNSSSEQNFDDRPLLGTATVDDMLQGYLLLMQRRYAGLIGPTSVGEELRERCDKAHELKDVRQLGPHLTIPGFIEAITLGFQVCTRTTRARLNDPSRVRRFAYSIDCPARGLLAFGG